MMRKLSVTVLLIVSCLQLLLHLSGQPAASAVNLTRREAHKKNDHHKHDEHNSMFHNHLSRKVFDRACAASKDTIDEIMKCISSNEHLTKTIDPKKAAECYKEAFNQEFDPNDISKHKEMICSNRDKFEQMTACTYRKTAESMSSKEIETLAESMVDVGLCIVNALDG